MADEHQDNEHGQTIPPLPALLTARQAADRIGVSTDSVHAYIRNGRLRNVAPVGCPCVLVLAAEVATFRRRPRGRKGPQLPPL